ncbi:Intersectin-2 [Drechslerella dactyloides]|uniref:Intersectin-2 n=1 Tax=Drechslerella dactyloides TaxID=74499 RepID=A0AAD6IRM9_DREDA|nr:Intersectin-2 [Drechslerella dactyloides]
MRRGRVRTSCLSISLLLGADSDISTSSQHTYSSRNLAISSILSTARMVDFQAAMAARAVRNIQTELEFLSDTGHITSAQLASILASLPPTGLTASLSNTAISRETASSAPAPAPVQTQTPVPAPTPVVAAQTHVPTFNEKADAVPAPAYTAAPPAYTHPPTLSVVTALYPYSASDAGDLALNVGDTINVTEYVNADWWRGVNPATGQTGIFPKNYVKAAAPASSGTEKEGYGYGNLPLQVANSGSSSQPQPQPDQQQEPSKFNEQGKKFGKKLGNAAIFGAGATIGGKIVNGIF